MKRILLVGHDGQVGGELLRTLAPLGELTALCYPDVDFADPDSIRRTIRNARPDILVNAAAYTAVDKAESEPELCRRINSGAPAILAQEAQRTGALLVHYSTDFVFDGAKRSPYTEDDPPRPLSVYGQTKLEGDRAIQASGAPHLIFRTAWVYGRRGRNFLLTVRQLAEQGKPVRIVSDQIGCPTWSRVIAETTAQALARVTGPLAILTPREASGLYNLVCGGETSWHGFARAFLPPETNVTAIAAAEYPTPARRPAYSALDCSKLRHVFGLELPSWQDALRRCLAEG